MAGVTVRKGKQSVRMKNRFYEITVDLKDGTWSARDRKAGVMGFKNAVFRLDCFGNKPWSETTTRFTCRQVKARTAFGEGNTLILTARQAEGYTPVRMLSMTLYPNRPFIEIGWGVRNHLSFPVRVGCAEVLCGGELFVDHDVEAPRVLRSGAGAEPNMVEKGWEVEALNGALLTYKSGGKRRSLVAGGLAYKEFGRRVALLNGRKEWGNQRAARVQDKGFRNLNLACWDPQGKTVQPGETYMSPDTCYLDFATSDPFEALESYGMAMRKANDAKPNTYDFPSLCGWMVSTRHLGEGKPINNSAGLVEQAQIARDRGLMKYTPLALRLEPDTYCYGTQGDTQQGWWDDAHWQAYGPGRGRASSKKKGSLTKPYETFAKFCKAIRDLGGIPFTYFQSSMPSNDFALAHPEWMLNGDISKLHMPHAHHRPWVRYDYTHPGFRAHCLKVWKRLRKAGLQGVKFDYPETAWASGGGFKDKTFTTTSAYCELFRLCREGLGPDAFVHERNLGGSTHEDAPRLDATAGIVDIQRVWGDASHFEAEMASRMGLRWYKSRSVFLYYPDGKSFYSDGKPLPEHERRAFLTIIAFLSGRLEIGTSIGSMTDEMFHDTTRLYPMFGGTKSPRPVDLLTGGKHPSVYAYRVTDGWQQVLLINNSKRGRRAVSAPLSGDMCDTGSLGLNPRSSYHAFEFWSQKYLGKIKGTGRLAVELRSGEVAMVSVRKVCPHPQVVSTNRHIMQGMMECHGIAWSGRQRALSGKVDVVGGEELVLTVACNGRKPVSCEGGRLRRRGRGLVDLVLSSPGNRRMRFAVSFK